MSLSKLSLESSHLNLPERIHEPSDSALVLEAITVSGFTPPPSKHLKHTAYFKGHGFFSRKMELYDPYQVKYLVNYMNDPNKPIGEPVTIINYKTT